MKIKAFLALLYVPVVALLLLLPLAARNRFERAVFDSVHAPLFALLAAALCWLLNRRFVKHSGRCALAAGLMAGGFGAVLEFLQGYFHRSSNWQDGAANLLGAAAGALWMSGLAAARTTGGKLGPRVLFVAAGLCLTTAEIPPLLLVTDVVRQRLQSPQVASFEDSLEMTRWQTRECRWSRVEAHATHGRFALRIELDGHAKYPGPIMTDPVADWTGYNFFRFDVWLEGDEPLPLVVKIYDTTHGGAVRDRFNRQYPLLPGPNFLKIPLAEVAAAPKDRELDLSAVKFLQFFLVHPDRPHTLYFDNLRLE